MAVVPFWTATITPPSVTAGSGGTAAIVVPQPTWGGSLTWTVEQTDSNGTAPSALSDPIDNGDGTITLTTTGLTVGDQVSFQVTVTDGSLAATSVATATITATL
jgi:hypothetical protein